MVKRASRMFAFTRTPLLRIEKQYPNLRGFCRRRPMSARPQRLAAGSNFISITRPTATSAAIQSRRCEFEAPGRISGQRPRRYSGAVGVNNVYGDVGQLFATTLVAEPNVCAALMAR